MDLNPKDTRTLETIRKETGYGVSSSILKRADVQALIDAHVESAVKKSGYSRAPGDVMADFITTTERGKMLYDALTRALPDDPPSYVQPQADNFDLTTGKIAKQMAQEVGCTPETATAELLKAMPGLYQAYLDEHPEQTGADAVEPSRGGALMEKAEAKEALRERSRQVIRKMRGE